MASGEWHSFRYRSDSGRYDVSRRAIYYTHWLPEDVTDLLPEKSQLMDVTKLNFYKKFDTLIHTTTFESASAIVRDGFKHRRVSDSSVVNQTYALMNWENQNFSRPRHPLFHVKMLWYGPCTVEQLKNPTFVTKRYGNVVFSKNRLEGYEGIYRENDGIKLYFIEVIKYKNSSACRILATHNNYPGLREFDPFTLGGPLYIDKRGKKFYYTSKLKSYDGAIVENILEIMEEEGNHFIHSCRFDNYSVSFCFCEEAKSDIAVVSRPEEEIMSTLLQNVLKLAIIFRNSRRQSPSSLPAFKFKCIQTPFACTQDRDKNLKMELENVHHKKVEEYEKRVEEMPNTNLDSLLHEAIQNTVFHDATVDFEELYLQMLFRIPKERHSRLPEEIFKMIREELEPE